MLSHKQNVILSMTSLFLFTSSCSDILSTIESHDLTEVNIAIKPGSKWKLSRDVGNVIATFESLPLSVLIDYTDETTDNRYAGLFITERNLELSGFYGFAKTAFFIPDQAVTQDTITIDVADSSFRVIMKQGNYGQIKETGIAKVDLKPITFDFLIEKNGGTIDLSLFGMYYFMLPKDGTQLIIYSQPDQIDTLNITLQTARMIRYFDNVDSLTATNKTYGLFKVVTDAKRLQVDVPDVSLRNDILFELDFDHSYKDFGQIEVLSKVSFTIH